jgi:rubrerythrin
MDMFEYAMQMEKDGEQYYRTLVEQTQNKGLRTIFTALADDEVKHYKVIAKMRDEASEMMETTILADAQNVFQEMKESGQSFDFDVKQIDIYRQAQQIEQQSWDFYLDKADEIGQPYQRELFLKLAEEEKKHYFILENIIAFVSRPETWLENAEFYHLEEY